MTYLGDRFREFAALCDKHPEWTAAGIVATPEKPACQMWMDTEGRPEVAIAVGLYHGVLEPPEPAPSPFIEGDEGAAA